MESANILAGIINHDCTRIGNKYFKKSLGIRIRLAFKTLKKPFMYNKILRKLVMMSGIKTIKNRQ
jgi:hypothetical protein